jgi:RNA polymerase sigma factor (sigma-70 family)
MVYGAALRRTDRNIHITEDIVQQVFATLALNAESLRKHTALTGWLYVATRHAAANAIRAEHRRKNREKEAHAMDKPSVMSPTEGDWDQLRPELDAVVDQLDERDRNAVLLRFFESKPFAEIGAVLGVSEDAARMRTDRALEKLRNLLSRRGLTSSAVTLSAMLTSHASAGAPAGFATNVANAVLAGTTTGGASTLLGFMSTSKIAIAVGTLLVVTGIGSAVYERGQARQINAVLEKVIRERDTSREQLARLDKTIQEAAQSSRATKTRTTGAIKGVADANTGSDNRPGLLASNPAYQKLALKYYAANLGLSLGPIFRKLGLSAAQISAVERVLTDQYQERLDMMAAANSQGIALSDPSLGTMRKQATEIVTEKLNAILGPNGDEQLSQFARTVDARASTVDPLASSLYYADSPLTAGQADQLMQIVAANTGGFKVTGLATTSPETNWDAVLTQAQQVLTPPQIATFQALREKAQLQKQLGDLSATLLQPAAAK